VSERGRLDGELAEQIAADIVEAWTGDRWTKGEALRSLARLAASGLQARDRLAGADVAALIAERDEARSWARHGYEIGQRSCLWSDHGVAPEWLKEGWPPHFGADPLTKAIGQIEDVLMHYRALQAQPPPAGENHP
jgi:hypothetical protein